MPSFQIHLAIAKRYMEKHKIEDKEAFIENINYHQFTENLYTSYDQTNEYLEEKYHIILKKELAERIDKEIEGSKKYQKVSDKAGKNILPLDKLDAFIERMSNMNLEEYITKE